MNNKDYNKSNEAPKVKVSCKHKNYKEVTEPFTEYHECYKCVDCGAMFDFT